MQLACVRCAEGVDVQLSGLWAGEEQSRLWCNGAMLRDSLNAELECGTVSFYLFMHRLRGSARSFVAAKHLHQGVQYLPCKLSESVPIFTCCNLTHHPIRR
eukprot:SAG11_NODE_1366_length_5104_cov_3.710090_2_plen_101_part_00